MPKFMVRYASAKRGANSIKSSPQHDNPIKLPPRNQWTVTMLVIDQLIKKQVFRSGDVMEFADIKKEAFQSWFTRSQVKNNKGGVTDPAPGGTGNLRLFTLPELLMIVAARQIGHRALGYALEVAFPLGDIIAWACAQRWMLQAHDYDKAEVSAGPEPLAVLKNLIVRAKNEGPEFLIFTIKDGKIIAKSADYAAELAAVWWAVQRPYFTVLDMRTPLLEFFFPIALRLFERVGNQDDAELKELERLFAKE